MDILEHPTSAGTARVLHELNRALLERAPSLLPLTNWQAFAANRDGRFTLGEAWVPGERDLIWEYRIGDTVPKGLNVMAVRNGLSVEGRGYTKASA